MEVARLLLDISCDGGFGEACVALRTLPEEGKNSNQISQSRNDPTGKYTQMRKIMTISLTLPECMLSSLFFQQLNIP